LCRSRGREATSDDECDVDAVGDDSSRAAMNLRALLLAAVASALVALGAADEYDHKVSVPPNLAPRASLRISEPTSRMPTDETPSRRRVSPILPSLRSTQSVTG
jgi:hypothetical protein